MLLNAAQHFEILHQRNTQIDTNWDLCFICQESSTSQLVCPAKNTSDDRAKSYQNIIQNLEGFSVLGELPDSLESRFNQPSLIDKFIEKNAKFHKTCKNRYDGYHYERACKKKKTCNSSKEQASSSVP